MTKKLRVVILSAYPLVDRHVHKKVLLDGLAKKLGEQIESLTVVYGGINAGAYLKEMQRNGGLRESFKLFKAVASRRTSNRAKVKAEQGRQEEGSLISPRKGTVSAMARQLGVAVKGFDRLGNPECLAYLHELRPTVAINLSGVYLSRKLLDSFEMGIIGGHYAELPRIRGGDTVRWTVLLDAPMIVTHMFLVPGLDLGDILRTVSIPVRRGDDILTIRGKCQAAAIAGHLELIDGLANGALERRRQQPEEGSTFYRMGDYLRGEVDRILREGQYGHYQ